jgi:hypothetical protein
VSIGTIDRCIREAGIACVEVVEELVEQLQQADILQRIAGLILNPIDKGIFKIIYNIVQKLFAIIFDFCVAVLANQRIFSSFWLSLCSRLFTSRIRSFWI